MNLNYDEKGAKDAFRVTLSDALKKWRDKIIFSSQNEYLILPKEYYEIKFLRRTDEGIDLLQSFYEYGIDYLYKSTNDGDKKPFLSRHDIMHGKDISYINDLNAYRLFSCLEALVFAVTLNPFS